jgi:N-acetyl-gamma-glutamyl-phosphate reductase
MSRGILDTVYARVAAGADAGAMRDCVARQCADNRFVHVLPKGAAPPQTGHVRGSSHCIVAVVEDRFAGELLLSALLIPWSKAPAGRLSHELDVGSSRKK